MTTQPASYTFDGGFGNGWSVFADTSAVTMAVGAAVFLTGLNAQVNSATAPPRVPGWAMTVPGDAAWSSWTSFTPAGTERVVALAGSGLWLDHLSARSARVIFMT